MTGKRFLGKDTLCKVGSGSNVLSANAGMLQVHDSEMWFNAVVIQYFDFLMQAILHIKVPPTEVLYAASRLDASLSSMFFLSFFLKPSSS